MDVGALTPPLWGFEEREKLMVFYERASRRAHACGLFPSGRRASGPAARSWSRTSASGATRSCKVSTIIDDLLTDNRIFKQRNVDIGVVSAGRRLGLGLLRRHGARLGRCLGSAQVRSLMNATPKWISIFRSARTATATTAT